MLQLLLDSFHQDVKSTFLPLNIGTLCNCFVQQIIIEVLLCWFLDPCFTSKVTSSQALNFHVRKSGYFAEDIS